MRSYTEYCRDDGKEFELDKKEFDEFLCDKSMSFKEAFKQLNILELYKVMASDKSVYTNGEARYTIGKYNLTKRFRRKLNKNRKRNI